MENITLGQVSAAIVFIVAFFGGIVALFTYIKKWLKLALKDEFETIKNELNDIGISDCKNFLVNCFGKIDSGLKLDETEKERFGEVYDLYTNKYHQNSYIHSKYEKLKKEGKL